VRPCLSDDPPQRTTLATHHLRQTETNKQTSQQSQSIRGDLSHPMHSKSNKRKSLTISFPKRKANFIRNIRCAMIHGSTTGSPCLSTLVGSAMGSPCMNKPNKEVAHYFSLGKWGGAGALHYARARHRRSTRPVFKTDRRRQGPVTPPLLNKCP
jgi:hypothetical protein